MSTIKHLMAAASIAVLATVAIGTWFAPGAGAVTGYTASANGSIVRADATTGAPQVRVLAAGTPLDIACQRAGQTVSIPGFGTSSLWDYVPALGGYVSDLLVNGTPYQVRDPRLPGCEGQVVDPGRPSGRPPSSARNIGYNPYAAALGSQCTYYAEQRMAQATGMFMPVTGNAYEFADQARAGGWTVGAVPLPASVVVFPRDAFGSARGHVAWTVEVAGNRIRVQDFNWNYVGAHVTDHWLTIPAGSAFIYSDR